MTNMPCLSEPTVSVIVAAYNAERYISETLKSIFAQTFTDFEVIVVDDGSTDRTPDIVHEHPGVHYLRQVNQGQPAARNAGIRAARGRYLSFLDADDLWLPLKLEKQVSYLLNHSDAKWVYCDAVLFDSDMHRVLGRIGKEVTLHAGDVLNQLFLLSFIPSPTPVIAREVFEEVGLFDESPALRIGEDWNMWLRIAARYPLGVVREPLALVRVHSCSMTQAASAHAVYRSKRNIVEQSAAQNKERLHDLKPRALAALAVGAGLRHLRSGRSREARTMFIEAARQRPSSIYSYCYIASTYMPAFAPAALHMFRRWFQSRRSKQADAHWASLLGDKRLT